MGGWETGNIQLFSWPYYVETDRYKSHSEVSE